MKTSSQVHEKMHGSSFKMKEEGKSMTAVYCVSMLSQPSVSPISLLYILQLLTAKTIILPTKRLSGNVRSSADEEAEKYLSHRST